MPRQNEEHAQSSYSCDRVQSVFVLLDAEYLPHVPCYGEGQDGRHQDAGGLLGLVLVLQLDVDVEYGARHQDGAEAQHERPGIEINLLSTKQERVFLRSLGNFWSLSFSSV